MSNGSFPSNKRFHLRTVTFVKHQKLATLSSKSPRENGNMRVTEAARVDMGENGGRKGAKRITKESVVTSASLVNSWRLMSVSALHICPLDSDHTPS